MKNWIVKIGFFSLLLLASVNCFSLLKNDSALKTGQLTNGLTYFIYPNAYPEDIVSLRLVVRVGSLMEEEHEQGLAHFTEHMLFKGTESFPANSLDSFLESQGMNSVVDFNASTSYDKTVYNLDIRKSTAKDRESLKTALKIMREWSRFASFNAQEIEKERGIVLQEKLSKEGVDKRLWDKLISLYYFDTLIADHSPIGKETVLKTLKRKDFLSFYDKWYRPERMSVVISGDKLNVKDLEKLIQESFGDLENASAETQKKVEEKVQSLSENLKKLQFPYSNKTFDSFPDKEFSCASLVIAQRQLGEQKAYLSSLSKESQLERAVNWLFVRRYSEILANSSSLTYQRVLKDQYFMANYLQEEKSMVNYLKVDLVEGREKEGLLSFFTEWERLRRHGFTEGELKLLKKTLLREANTAYQAKGGRSSQSLVESLVSLSLGESTLFPSPDLTLKSVKEFVGALTLSQLNEALRADLREDGWLYFYAYHPEGNQLLSQKDVVAIREKASEQELEPYIFQETLQLTGESFPKVPSPKSKLVSKSSGFYSWVLDNGIQVYFRPCQFPSKKVLMFSKALGFVGLKSADQWRRVIAAPYLVNRSGWGLLSRAGTDQFLSDKNLNLKVGYESISTGRFLEGDFDLDSAESFFESLYALLRLPKIDALARAEAKQMVKERILAEERDYQTPFTNLWRKTLFEDNPFQVFSMREVNLEALDSPELLEFYQAQFRDLQAFPFVFVGDIKKEVLMDLTARYLGILKLSPTPPADQKDPLSYRSGALSSSVANDPESRVTVSLNFTQNDVKNLTQDDQEAYALERALELAYTHLLTEQVREAISGVYNINLSSFSEKKEDGFRKNCINIEFVTSPAQLDQVREAVEKVLRQGQQEGFSEEILNYLRKHFAKKYKYVDLESSYWITYGINQLLYGGKWEHKKLETYLRSLTSERLRELARNLIRWETKKEITLFPKKNS